MFDLFRFDAKATDLDLTIRTAEKLEISIRQIAAQITGPINAVSRFIRKWVRNIFFIRERIIVQVTFCQIGSANTNLPELSDSGQLLISSQNEQLNSLNPPTDGNRFFAPIESLRANFEWAIHRKISHCLRRLGGSIKIHAFDRWSQPAQNG